LAAGEGELGSLLAWPLTPFAGGFGSGCGSSIIPGTVGTLDIHAWSASAATKTASFGPTLSQTL